jgi:hypothetical protein
VHVRGDRRAPDADGEREMRKEASSVLACGRRGRKYLGFDAQCPQRIRSRVVNTVVARCLSVRSEGRVAVRVHAQHAGAQCLGVRGKGNGQVGRFNFHTGPDLQWAGPSKFFSE